MSMDQSLREAILVVTCVTLIGDKYSLCFSSALNLWYVHVDGQCVDNVADDDKSDWFYVDDPYAIIRYYIMSEASIEVVAKESTVPAISKLVDFIVVSLVSRELTGQL